MTPVNLNPPPSPFQLAQQRDEQHLHLYYLQYSSHLPPPPPSSSPSYPPFLNSTSTQDQPMIKLEDSQLLDQKVDQSCIDHGGSSDDLQMFPSTNSIQPTMNNNDKTTREVGEGSTSDNGSSAKWMSSKMRLMQKMMTSNSTGTDESAKNTQKLQYQLREHDNNEVNSFNNSNNTIRVCTECNTTTTPLWRSGPRGPKSLCNACGIRQRKARRAMEAAAAAARNGTLASTDSPSTKIKLPSKENIKWRTNHVPQYKKQCKSPDHPHHQGQRKLCFKDFAPSLSKNSALKQVFPPDVEEAAILLMELSCGFIHS